MMRAMVFGAALLASIGSASAEVDLDRPVEVMSEMPLCAEAKSLVTVLRLLVQGAYDMVNEVPGCIALKNSTRVYIMETHGSPALLLVRWRQPNGVHAEAWTMQFFLRNIESTTGSRRRS